MQKKTIPEPTIIEALANADSIGGAARFLKTSRTWLERRAEESPAVLAAMRACARRGRKNSRRHFTYINKPSVTPDRKAPV